VRGSVTRPTIGGIGYLSVFDSKILFMKIQVFFSLLIFSFLQGKAQTNVPASLYSNTHWTTAGSPYIVSGNTVLFNTDTLIIDPGVTVKFNAGAGLEIRGFMYAFGTPNDSIEFTSNDSTPQIGSWAGIKVITPNGTISRLNQVAMSYCKASYASFFMNLGGTINGPYIFTHCYFACNDNVGSACDGGVWPVIFDSCMFYGNNSGASGTTMTNSSFINNVNGVAHASQVYSCYFSGNTGIAAATYGSTIGCTFVNNAIAFQNNFNGANDTFINNYVVDNDTGIIITQQYANSADHFTGNTICNSFYNIILSTANPADLSHNCWCSSDSATIRSKIYDGYVDNAYGLVSFSPISASCAAPLGEDEVTNPSLLSISPNPFSENLHITNASGKDVDLVIYDMNGKNLISDELMGDKEISTSAFAPGIYIYEMLSDNKVKRGKIVKY
jgi:hypothetical protein